MLGTSLVIADDHVLFRTGLQYALQNHKHLYVMAAATNGEELCAAVEKHRPDVVITDLSMPAMSGLEAMRHIRQRHPKTGLVVLSVHEEASVITEAMQAGAHAYLLKTANLEDIEKAVQSAKIGKAFFSATTLAHLGNVVQYLCGNCALTNREKAVIGLLFQEFTSKQIGQQLHLSERTVEEYRKHILEKTGSKNTVGIIKYALRQKIVDLQ